MIELKTLKDIRRMSFQTKRGIHEDDLKAVAKEWVVALKEAVERDEPIYPPCFHKEHDTFLSTWHEVYLSMAVTLGHIFNLE